MLHNCHIAAQAARGGQRCESSRHNKQTEGIYMKKLTVLASVFCSVFAIGCAGERSTELKDMETERSLKYHYVTVGTDLDLDMKFDRLARLKLSLEAANGMTYKLLEQENAVCAIESIRTESFGVLVDITFDPELEDGLNACTVALSQPDASTTLITLFQIVDDGETKLYTKSLRTLDQDYSIDMLSHDAVWLVLKGETSLTHITADIGQTNMASCKVQNIQLVDENVVVLVDFEADLEDGLNNCIVEISNSSFTSSVELFHAIDN